MCLSEQCCFYFIVMIVAVVGVITMDFSMLMSDSSGFYNIKERNETKLFETRNGPIQYHLTSSSSFSINSDSKDSSSSRELFLYIHGTPGGYEEGANFMKSCPKDWIVVSPSRIGYGLTNYSKIQKEELHAMRFYFPVEEKFAPLVNAFDIANVTHLLKIYELESSQSGRNLTLPPLLNFLIERNGEMMIDLMNHLFGSNSRFNIIAVSGGGPFGMHIAKKYSSRVKSLQLIAPVTRNLMIGRGETPRKLSNLVQLMNEKQEKNEEIIISKIGVQVPGDDNDDDSALTIANNLKNKFLQMDVDEPKPFNATIGFGAFAMDPSVIFRSQRTILKLMSYMVVRLVKFFPDLILKFSIVNTEPEMLDMKCLEKTKFTFDKYQLREGLEYNIATIHNKNMGYITDLLLFLQFSKNQKEFLQSIKTPTLIQASIFDKTVDYEDQIIYSFQHLPNSKLITYGDCGQLFFANHFDKVFHHINNFIKNEAI